MTWSVWLDIVNYVGLTAFALSGALLAVRKQFDLVGMVVLASITCFGGGIVRDVLIGDVPPLALRHSGWLVVPLAATVLAFFFHPQITKLRRAIVFFDAIGLGVFAAGGALRATQVNLSPLPAAIIGVVTGIGGGILRDLLAGDVPAVLRRDSQLYAIPAVLGCGLLVGGLRLGLPAGWSTFGAALFISGLRLLAVLLRWRGPVARTVYR